MSDTIIATAGELHTQSRPRDSLDRMGVAFYLLVQDEAHRNATRLRTMAQGRKDGPDREALWSGAVALNAEANQAVAKLRDRGGLLFVGQPAAIRAAQALEGGAA